MGVAWREDATAAVGAAGFFFMGLMPRPISLDEADGDRGDLVTFASRAPRARLFVGVAVALILMVGGDCWWWLRKEERERGGDGDGDGKRKKVVMVKVMVMHSFFVTRRKRETREWSRVARWCVCVCV